MPQVTDSIDVKAPISAVYALWTQFEDFPKFMGGVESITQQTDTMLHWVVSIKGVERELLAGVLARIAAGDLDLARDHPRADKDDQ